MVPGAQYYDPFSSFSILSVSVRSTFPWNHSLHSGIIKGGGERIGFHHTNVTNWSYFFSHFFLLGFIETYLLSFFCWIDSWPTYQFGSLLIPTALLHFKAWPGASNVGRTKATHSFSSLRFVGLRNVACRSQDISRSAIFSPQALLSPLQTAQFSLHAYNHSHAHMFPPPFHSFIHSSGKFERTKNENSIAIFTAGFSQEEHRQ